MEKILEITNLSKSFEEFALKNISFVLEPGYIMGFIGPNGSGKTTTIKLIMNLLKKNSGEIKIFGKDHLKYEKEIKEDIGFVYDQSYFYEELTVREMTEIIAPFYKNWDQKQFNGYLFQFELPKEKKIKKFSKGMKMKYALAVALSHQAKFIILDEPTAGLDPIIRSELVDILYDTIRDGEVSILFSTHITKDLDKVADYITFINNGRLIFSQTKDLVLDTFSVIKGDKTIIDPSLRKHLIGLREHGVGFEALIENKSLGLEFAENFLLERPALEDILLFMVRGLKND